MSLTFQHFALCVKCMTKYPWIAFLLLFFFFKQVLKFGNADRVLRTKVLVRFFQQEKSASLNSEIKISSSSVRKKPHEELQLQSMFA